MKYAYTFADGSISAVEVSEEIAAVLAELDRAEKSNDRRETRRHVSMDKLLDKGMELRDYSQDLEFIEECERFERKELRLEQTQRQVFNKYLTEKQSEVFYRHKILKYKNTKIARQLSITEGAVRKLIYKAENKLYPIALQVLKESGFKSRYEFEDINFESEFLLDLLLKS
jgi:RNA polymerase sigma-70 factor (ECF subfamily)